MASFTCDDYDVLKCIGTGGIAEVWEGKHKEKGYKAAIKVLQPHMSKRVDIVQRFEQEARAVAAIQHPGIVELYEFGETNDHRAYIAMELLSGESLSTRLDRETRIGYEQTVQFMRQLVGAMKAVHARNILHRDLKPDNLFIVESKDGEGERLKVLDFGFAKLVSDLSGDDLTSADTIFGTPAYMAPEQWRNPRDVDAGADLYSIGCIFYHCICGRPPFQFDNPFAAMNAHLTLQPISPQALCRDVPENVGRSIMRLLRKSPEDRPQSCQQLLTELERLNAPTERSWNDSGEATAVLTNLSLNAMLIKNSNSKSATGEAGAGSREQTRFAVGSDAIPVPIADQKGLDTEPIVAGHLMTAEGYDTAPTTMPQEIIDLATTLPDADGRDTRKPWGVPIMAVPMIAPAPIPLSVPPPATEEHAPIHPNAPATAPQIHHVPVHSHANPLDADVGDVTIEQPRNPSPLIRLDSPPAHVRQIYRDIQTPSTRRSRFVIGSILVVFAILILILTAAT